MKRTGAWLTVYALEQIGARFTFGIPGVHTTELYDALNNSNRITQVLVTHEGGAAFMAEMSVSWPDVGRVLMTGAASFDHVTEVPCAAFVRKPFLLDDIVRALCVAANGEG